MGNKNSSSPQKGSIKAPGYLASVLPFLEPGDGVRELEAYLRANSDSQLMVAQALANQSVDSQFRRNVVAHGGLRILRLLLTSSEHNVVLCASHTLGNMAVDEGNHNDMVQTGCFHELMDLLSSGQADLQCKAARAVTNLCVSTKNKQIFDELGAVGALMALARHPNAGYRVEAVAALGNLAVDDDLELKIVQKGGIEAVISCMDADIPELREHAERALRNLTTSDANKRYYQSLGHNSFDSSLQPFDSDRSNRSGPDTTGETKQKVTFDSGGKNAMDAYSYVRQKEFYNSSEQPEPFSSPNGKSNTINNIVQQALERPTSPLISSSGLHTREISHSTYGVGRRTMDEFAEAAAKKLQTGHTDEARLQSAQADFGHARTEAVKTTSANIHKQDANYVGSETSPAPPASPWSKILDPASNHYYWFNYETKESRWTPPTVVANSSAPPAQSLSQNTLPDPLYLQTQDKVSPKSAMRRGHGRKATGLDLKEEEIDRRRPSRGQGRRGTLIVEPDKTIYRGSGKRSTIDSASIESQAGMKEQVVPVQQQQQQQQRRRPQQQQQQQQPNQHQNLSPRRKGTILSAMTTGLPPPDTAPADSQLHNQLQQTSTSTPTHKGHTNTMTDAVQILLPPTVQEVAASTPLPASSSSPSPFKIAPPPVDINLSPPIQKILPPPIDTNEPPPPQNIIIPPMGTEEPPPTHNVSPPRVNTIKPPPPSNVAPPPTDASEPPPSIPLPGGAPPSKPLIYTPPSKAPQSSTSRPSSTKPSSSTSLGVALPPEPHPLDLLSDVEKQIVEAINSARSNPAGFAERLVEMKQRLGDEDVLIFEWG